jgi:hypothetical protein
MGEIVVSSSSVPPSGPEGPEFLEPDREPLPPQRGGGGRRTVLAAGALAVGLAVVGGGVWAAMAFFATGSQPAEALPSSTVGYASVDLDPSGEQKIEAFRMIEKFPELKKELDGFDADDDLLELVFEDLEKECDGLDYAEDVKPWLGYRFAMAAVDLGEEQPTPVGVVQVTDADAAGDGLTQLKQCAGADVGGWVVEGEWALIAETQDLARQVSDATADGSLAEDSGFQRWTDEVGDPGVLTMYAAPEAGTYLAEFMATPVNPLSPLSSLSADGPQDEFAEPGTAPEAEVPDEMVEALEGFEGMAATLRFDDGALEFAGASGGIGGSLEQFASDGAAESVGALPEDTAVALGLSLPDGWFDAAVDYVAQYSGGEVTTDELLGEMEDELGLTGEDIETLLGSSAAIALGSDLDPNAFFSSSDGSDIPVGARITGDGAGIQEVLDKIAAEDSDAATVLAHDAEGDVVSVGPNADYRAKLLGDGGLGDTEVFGNVVREADRAGAIMFVNFDAGDWLTKLAQGDASAEENLRPLQGVGVSSWIEDDTSHVVFRLTTD